MKAEQFEYVLIENSRIDNTEGYIITTKPYRAKIRKECKYGFVIITIGKTHWKTDQQNLKKIKVN